jgi:hypothetical protein
MLLALATLVGVAVGLRVGARFAASEADQRRATFTAVLDRARAGARGGRA